MAPEPVPFQEQVQVRDRFWISSRSVKRFGTSSRTGHWFGTCSGTNTDSAAIPEPMQELQQIFVLQSLGGYKTGIRYSNGIGSRPIHRSLMSAE